MKRAGKIFQKSYLFKSCGNSSGVGFSFPSGGSTEYDKICFACLDYSPFVHVYKKSFAQKEEEAYHGGRGIS